MSDREEVELRADSLLAQLNLLAKIISITTRLDRLIKSFFYQSSSSYYLGSGGKRTFLLRPAPESLNDWDLLTFVLFPGSCRESPLIDHSP